MTYKKRPDIENLEPGETAVELDDGSLVAVGCKHLRCTISQNPVFEVWGRWINEQGETRKDAHGNAVETRHRHSATPAQVDLHGRDKMIRACLCLALGEPIETFKVDDGEIEILPLAHEIKSSTSIRNAVDAAARTFETIQTGDLL